MKSETDAVSRETQLLIDTRAAGTFRAGGLKRCRTQVGLGSRFLGTIERRFLLATWNHHLLSARARSGPFDTGTYAYHQRALPCFMFHVKRRSVRRASRTSLGLTGCGRADDSRVRSHRDMRQHGDSRMAERSFSSHSRDDWSLVVSASSCGCQGN